MKLTYPLLLNAKPQDKPYKIRDRDDHQQLPPIVEDRPCGGPFFTSVNAIVASEEACANRDAYR